MSRPPRLALGYLEHHPRQAADAIAALQTADAVALLDSVPTRICADVLAKAVPWTAAAWVENMETEHATAVLQEMLYQDATAIVRLVNEKRRNEVLDGMPTRLANKFRRSLTYPLGSVGAWMDPSVATFDSEATVKEGQKFLKSRRRRPIPYLIVVGERKVFAGLVSAADLVRSAPDATLAQIMDASVKPLSNRSLLGSVLEDPAWDDYPLLPVVGRKGNVLGVLSKKQLRKGIRSRSAPAEADDTDSMLFQLCTDFIAVAAGLARIVSQPEPRQ